MAIGAYDPIIAEASRRFGVPEERIRAVMKVESNAQPWARSPKGASGLMQVMPDTYTELAKRHGFGPDRFNPTNNIMAGTAYLGEMYDQFGNWDEATQAYNMGPGRAMKVRNGTASVPAETVAYLPRVNAALGISANNGQGGDVVPGLMRPRPGQTTGMGPMFGAARSAMPGSLLEVDDENNFQNGLGLLGNFGQTPSQPPRTDPAALPGTTQTDRLDLSGRINEMIKDLSQPGGRPKMPSELEYMLGGMQQGAQGLTGIHDRPVGIGEMLGALGGGATSGFFASNQARFKDRESQFQELSGLTNMQKYQRGEATAAAKTQAARDLAAQLRASGDPTKIAMADAIDKDPSLLDNVIPKMAEYAFPKPVRGVAQAAPKGMTTVTLGNGPQGPGVYSYDPNTGQTGPRLGASETGQDVTDPNPNPEQRQQQEEQRRSQAISLGLPIPPASPFENPNLSPRGKSNLVAAEARRSEKILTASDEAAAAAAELARQAQQFIEINQRQETGGFTNGPVGSTLKGFWNDDIKEMASISARIAPSLRQPGSGATSDYDAAQFKQATIGVDKPLEVNRNIANGYIAAAQNLSGKAEFERSYFDTYGHLAGAPQAWKRYLEANPIFDPTAKPGEIKLNEGRMKWQDFFRRELGVEPQKDTTIPPPPGSVIIQ
jgi:hypothetical protein